MLESKARPGLDHGQDPRDPRRANRPTRVRWSSCTTATWSRPILPSGALIPSAARSRDGYVCGRGTLDTKGLGIMELMAFLDAPSATALDLTRDLVFLAAADEEMGGDLGMDWLVKNHYDKIKGSLVINEGGIGVSATSSAGKVLHMVATGEKGLCWLELYPHRPPRPRLHPPRTELPRKAEPGAQPALDGPHPLRGEARVAEYFRNLARGWEFPASRTGTTANRRP